MGLTPPCIVPCIVIGDFDFAMAGDIAGWISATFSKNANGQKVFGGVWRHC